MHWYCTVYDVCLWGTTLFRIMQDCTQALTILRVKNSGVINAYWIMMMSSNGTKKNPRYWRFVREFTGDRWIPLTIMFVNGRVRYLISHYERDGVWNHQHHDCLLNRLFWRRSMKTSKLRVTGLCKGNSPVTGEFPAQMASNAESIFIW